MNYFFQNGNLSRPPISTTVETNRDFLRRLFPDLTEQWQTIERDANDEAEAESTRLKIDQLQKRFF